MKRGTWTAVAGLLCGAVLAGATMRAAGSIIIASDDFRVDTDTVLPGRVTPVGGLTWTGNTDLIIPAADDFVVIKANPENIGNQKAASIPYTFPETGIVTLQADLTDNCGWLAFGFSTASTSANLVSAGHGWVRLDGTTLYNYKGSGLVAFDSNATVNAGTSPRVTLEWNLDTGVLDVFVNGSTEPVASQAYDTVPAIQSAAIMLLHPSNNPPSSNAGDLDNFTLSYIPEPSTLGLLALTALPLLARRRARRGR